MALPSRNSFSIHGKRAMKALRESKIVRLITRVLVCAPFTPYATPTITITLSKNSIKWSETKTKIISLKLQEPEKP